MRPPAALASLALLVTLASGFSISSRTFVPNRPSSIMSSTATATTTAAAGSVRLGPCSDDPHAPLTRPASPSVLSIRGGAKKTASSSSTEASAGSRYAAEQAASSGESGSKCPVSFLASVWGAGGVSYILLKSVKRILPIALEPFAKATAATAAEGSAGAAAAIVPPLTSFQLVAYVATCVWFAYVEGYKGFQTKFSPLVVSRSRTLVVGKSSFVHILLAPLYSMGLFHATKKRMIVSWGVTLGVAGIVAAVKRLPYPWRNIVDAGVVVGLTWGTASIVLGFVKAMAEGESPVDPALPEKEQA